MRYLTRADLLGLGLGMGEIVAAVEAGCRARGEGGVLMPPKLSLHRGDGAFSQALAAWLPGSGGLGLKWVTLFPANAALGLPLLSGLVIVNDPQDGRPVALMDAAVITAWRTGASAAVAARHLARPDAACLALLGCGAQGRSSVRALAAVLPELGEVRCCDVFPEVTAACVAELRAELPHLRFAACASSAELLAGADVVVTAITMDAVRRPAFDAGRLAPGALAVALDYDAAWTGAAMAECDRFYCDDRAGVEAVRASGSRLSDIPVIAGDLGELAAGRVPGRQTASERLFCCNLGMAVEDIVTANLALERARRLDVGIELPL